MYNLAKIAAIPMLAVVFRLGAKTKNSYKMGTVDLNASVDADLGDGVVTITAVAHITVLPEQATKLDIIFD